MSTMKIILYVKTHNITGLKYFGKTTRKDPQKYQGSGKYWKRHIEKHGYDVTTEIVGEFYSIEEAETFALKFSEENNIIESNTWANLQLENAKDGAPIGHVGHIFTIEEREILSIKSTEMWQNTECRSKIITAQKNSWTEERKQEQSDRLTGKKRPEHSETMKGRRLSKDHPFYKLATSERSATHKENISAALTGKKKSEEHKEKLRVPKPKVVCRIHDRLEMSLANFMNWLKNKSNL